MLSKHHSEMDCCAPFAVHDQLAYTRESLCIAMVVISVNPTEVPPEMLEHCNWYTAIHRCNAVCTVQILVELCYVFVFTNSPRKVF